MANAFIPRDIIHEWSDAIGDDPTGQLADVQRATELVRGFAERNDLAITDI